MDCLDLNPRALDVAGNSLAGEAPCFMLNLLRYRETADYGDASREPASSGRNVYFTRYIPAWGRLAGDGAKPIWLGRAVASLVAPMHEHWDDIGLLRYSSFQAFRDLVESAPYRAEAEPHRLAALVDWRLIVALEMPTPGAVPTVGSQR